MRAFLFVLSLSALCCLPLAAGLRPVPPPPDVAAPPAWTRTANGWRATADRAAAIVDDVVLVEALAGTVWAADARPSRLEAGSVLARFGSRPGRLACAGEVLVAERATALVTHAAGSCRITVVGLENAGRATVVGPAGERELLAIDEAARTRLSGDERRLLDPAPPRLTAATLPVPEVGTARERRDDPGLDVESIEVEAACIEVCVD